MTESLHVAFASPEVAPFVKTGGLADVSAALPKALARRGHRVTVLLPRYGSIPFPPGEFAGSVPVPVDRAHRSAGFYVAEGEEGIRTVFVDHAPFFDRPFPYGVGNRDYEDNRLRFAFFARACLEFFRSRGQRPDVFHAHDWQTGLLPVYLKVLYWHDAVLARVPTVFTIHNLAYQGNFGLDTLEALGLPAHLTAKEGVEFHGHVSYLKAGLLFSEVLTTVSPTYAREITTPEHGYGLDGVLRARSGDLAGILNGVDYEEWDPRVDPHIARPYSATRPAGKAACKADLLAAFSLPAEPELPLLGVISRLVHQKGFDLLVAAGEELLRRPLRLVVLGTGEHDVQAGLRRLAQRAPDRVAVRFAYEPTLAHRIEAGADMFLMPSRYEPCGLTQMYSLRYGTVPVVRATGGLVDTVVPWNPATGEGTGFLFEHADAGGLLWGIDQALDAWRDPKGWRRLMRNGMSRDFSWLRAAGSYEAVYGRAMGQA
jgi:starch synthase